MRFSLLNNIFDPRYKLLLALLIASPLFSDDPGPPPAHYHQKMYDRLNVTSTNQLPNTLTGDWNGARAYLQEKGVIVSSSFVTDIVGNPIGGQARGFSYAGSLGTGLGIDFERALGWTGLSFYGSFVCRNGTSLTRKKIGNQFTVQQVFGSQTIKLNELYLTQTLWDDIIHIKAGRLDAGNDFLASALYAQFVNNGFNGNPVSVFNNFPSFSAFPNATWGAYVFFQPIPQLQTKWAIYNANTQIFLNQYHGVNFTFQSTNGVILITEWAALLNQEPGNQGLAGNYKVGFFYQTGNTTNFQKGTVQGDFCTYFLFDQMIYRPAKRINQEGLTAFLTLLFTPNTCNLLPFFTTSGLVYKGLIPHRPDDTTNLGFVYGGYSSTLAQVQKEALKTPLLSPNGSLPQSFEAVIEFNHWFQINEWFTITPDFQYIINPKGTGTIRNAFVIGTQIGFSL